MENNHKIPTLAGGELVAWDVYYASLITMAMHPGNKQNETDLELYGEIADYMIEVRRKRST